MKYRQIKIYTNGDKQTFSIEVDKTIDLKVNDSRNMTIRGLLELWYSKFVFVRITFHYTELKVMLREVNTNFKKIY